MKKKTGIILTLILCLFILPMQVHATAKDKVRVKVNNDMYATMELVGRKWTMTLPEDAPYNPFENRVLYLGMPRGSSLRSGYYVFDKKGRMYVGRKFHTLKAKVYKQRFDGDYYFGETNGRLMLKKAGWVTYRKNKYYISNTGRKCVNRWVKGYYLLDTGLIAKNMQTPDGHYVDCNGRKCEKGEMKLSGLKSELQSMIKGYAGIWSVYVKDMKTGDYLSINHRLMKPASVIKLFTMASTYQSIKKGEIEKNSRVDSLLRSMITVSSNEAYNALTRLHSKNGHFLEGCKKVNKNLKKLGCKNTESHSTLHPSSSACMYDGRNLTTAKDAGIILEKIYKGKCVSSKYSKEMLNLLLQQQRRSKIPAGLPAGTKCANKTGENSNCQNDVAIVYGKETDYVVCIFAETLSEYNGIRGIRNLSSRIYSCLNK